MYLAANDPTLRDPYNPDKPLDILYKRLKKCVNYAIALGEPVTKGQIDQIAYRLIVETGTFQEDCRTWRAKSEHDKTWIYFQAHFVKLQ